MTHHVFTLVWLGGAVWILLALALGIHIGRVIERADREASELADLDAELADLETAPVYVPQEWYA